MDVVPPFRPDEAASAAEGAPAGRAPSLPTPPRPPGGLGAGPGHVLGLLLALGALLAAPGCGGTTEGSGDDSGGAGASEPSPEPPPSHLRERLVGDLVAALEPPAADSPTSVQDDWIRRRRLMLARMRTAGPEVGRLVLEEFHERPDAPQLVREGLLEAASLAAPEATRELLVELVTEYGEDLGVRTQACGLLGASSPEVAIRVLGGVLLDPDRPTTSPPGEALLAGWLEAHRRLDTEPLPELAHVATDLHRDQATRHLAVRALADYPSPVTRAALEEVLVESTGNAYLRRRAAQSLVAILTSAELCPLLERVHAREADTNFKAFLADVLADHCP